MKPRSTLRHKRGTGESGAGGAERSHASLLVEAFDAYDATLMTWLGAKVVGEPRSYDESNFGPDG